MANTPDLPPSRPPNSVEFSHTEGWSTALFYTTLLMPIFSIPIVLLRLWTSQHVVNKWHMDDSLIVVSAILSIFNTAIMCVSARLGCGDHTFNVSEQEFQILLEISRWGGIPLYAVNTFIIKTAIMIFYLRFSVDKAFEIFIYILLFVTAAYSSVVCVSVMALQCYQPTDSGCQTITQVFIAGASINVATDIAILLLPFWILRPMKVSTWRKLGIAMILMAGGFVSAISIFRLTATLKVSAVEDLTYEWGNSVMWSVIEFWTGLICACLPCIKPFFSRHFPSFRLWSIHDHSGSGSMRQLRTID